jgi:hypothetical protein
MKIPTRKLSSDDLRRELASFEAKHGMTSSQFYNRFRAGELGDDAEFMRWAGLCYIALRTGVLAPQPV